MSDSKSDQRAAPQSLDLYVDASAMLRWNNVCFPCAIGKNGISQNKIEGDGTTPMGIFPRAVFSIAPTGSRHHARRCLLRR